MKLLTIATKYKGYLEQFYYSRRDLLGKPYEEQYNELMSDSIGSSETWSIGMAERGYDTVRIYFNANDLQARWAKENGLLLKEKDWKMEVLFAQVASLKPDIVFVNNFSIFSPGQLPELKKRISSIKLIIGWCGIPFRTPDVFRDYDLVMTNMPELLREFSALGLKTRHLNHSFDPRIPQRIDCSKPKKIEFSFIGSVSKGEGFHMKREKLLMELVRKTPIQIWGNISSATKSQRFKAFLSRFVYDLTGFAVKAGIKREFLKKAPVIGSSAGRLTRPSPSNYIDPKLACLIREPVYGLQMYQLLKDSKVTLNTHIDYATEGASNMRLFEATGMGTCLLTDRKDNLSELFESDSEVVSYKDAEECIEKVNYLLSHEKERETIAEAGRKKALKYHTIYHRAEQVDEYVKSII